MYGNDEFNLTATISAAELSALQRRGRFLEAALVQLLRGRSNLKEWFSVAELVEMQLPGLPTTTAGMTRLARSEHWSVKSAGNKHLYHFSGLPRRAFEALIDLVLKDGVDAHTPEAGSAETDLEASVPIAEPVSAVPKQRKSRAVAATPSWVLPLLRIIRHEGKELEAALALLPDRVSMKTSRPSLAEARAILTELGLLAI